MTAKRDSKQKPNKRPALKKETLKDLEAKEAEKVRAGRAQGDSQKVTCSCNCA